MTRYGDEARHAGGYAAPTGKKYTPPKRTGTYTIRPVGGQSSAMQSQLRAASDYVRSQQGGSTPILEDVYNYDRARTAALRAGQRAAPGAAPAQQRYLGSSGGRYGGGGGGGAAGLTAEQAAWLAALLKAGAPTQGAFSALDLPDMGAFNPAKWDTLLARWNEAGALDRATGTQAYTDLGNTLRANFNNAYVNPTFATQGTAPGMTQLAMERMLRAQGVDPTMLGEERGYAAGADAAFGNLMALLGANEQQTQQSRLGQVAMDQNTFNRALDAALLQGRAGIDISRTSAQEAWDAQVRELAQQEAMANWQRQNTLQDAQTQALQAYRNQQIETMLGLMPSLGTNLPTLEALGIA